MSELPELILKETCLTCIYGGGDNMWLMENCDKRQELVGVANWCELYEADEDAKIRNE